METSSSSPAPSANSRWILLVDDEPAIIPLITTILKKEGWTVKEASNGEAAMAAIETAATPPSLLICDVLMPGIDGLELTRRILGRLPKLKVIFISGHLTDVSWWPADLRGHRFVAKPFSIEVLATAVSEALDDRDGTN
ncbi:MAG TPA: response regulator [Opitutaceae bacterium]|nr:response regulator [Opitutaceae bacterium]